MLASQMKVAPLSQADVVGERPFARVAVIMIGYQRDYFGKDGKLHAVVEASSDAVLANTLKLVAALDKTPALFIETPIIFTKDSRELIEPSGILKIIKDVGAFAAGQAGSETIPEIKALGDRVIQIPGKR